MPTATQRKPTGRGPGRPKKSAITDEKSVKPKTPTGVSDVKDRHIGASPTDDAAAPDPQDVDLVRETLRAICRDTTAPAAARAQAARTLAEMVGALGRHAAPPPPPGKPLSELKRDELEAELAALTGE